MTAKSRVLNFEPITKGQFEGMVRTFNPANQTWLIAPSYTAGQTTTITHIVKKSKCCDKVVVKKCGTKETRYAKKPSPYKPKPQTFQRRYSQWKLY